MMNWHFFVGKTWRYNICCTTVNTIVSSVPFFEQLLNTLTRGAMWLRRAMNANQMVFVLVFAVTVISDCVTVCGFHQCCRAKGFFVPFIKDSEA
jgi:hypothetical protein